MNRRAPGSLVGFGDLGKEALAMRSGDLPYIVALLDDPSPVVQAEINSALTAAASHLGQFFEEQKERLGREDRLKVHRFLVRWRKAQVLRSWSGWVHQFFGGGYAGSWECLQYEKAHAALDVFASSILESTSLHEQLDELAGSLRQRVTSDETLFEALFPGRFEGQTDGYYNPDKSYLARVLRLQTGNPISLASIFILVGSRLGLSLRPCNFPGHFLARSAQGTHFYDCFRAEKHGPELSLELRGGRPPQEFEHYLAGEVPTETVVARVLRNLVAAYFTEERATEGNLFHLLYKDLLARQGGLGLEYALREPIYGLGQVVSHRDKEFRGVIVDYNLYDSSQEGLAHEPVYSVLVHESPQVASVRESRLYLDKSGSLVAHPFVGHFFSKYENGSYLRNSRAWMEKK